MKTNKEVLDFYGVKLGKKYEITNDTHNPTYFIGRSFIVKEDDDDIEISVESDTHIPTVFDIHILCRFSYEEVKEPKKWKDMKCGEVPCDICPIHNITCWIDATMTLQENLNKTELDDEEREFYQKRIDREYKEE